MSATGVVTLYPATVQVGVNLSSLNVTYLSTTLNPIGGGQSSTKSVNISTPGPYTMDVTVDGGNPADPADSGFSYSAYLYASISNGASGSSSLNIYKYNPIHVDNTPEQPSITVAAPFDYPAIHRANGTLTVIGGTISSYYLYASASDSAANESYSANTYVYGGNQAVATGSVPMVARSSVTVYGSAYVVDGNGVTVYRSLGSQVVDMSAGDTTASWTIDLSSTSTRGRMVGDVSLTPSGAAATPSYIYAYYYGVSSSTSGISGTVQVSSAQSSYSVLLNPGDYNVYLAYSSNTPSQSWYGPTTRVTIDPGVDTVKDFTHTLGVGHVALDVKGFYDLSRINSAYSYLTSTSGLGNAYNYQSTAGSFEHTVPVGDWRSYMTYLQIYDLSNPVLPNNNQIYRYHYNDGSLPSKTISAGTTSDLGTDSVTLVESNVYFDVIEPEPVPPATKVEVRIRDPQVTAYKYDYNSSDSSLRQYTYMYSYGSSSLQPVSGLTMVAEPGVYQIAAYATLEDGTRSQFRGTHITFGEPVTTPAGAGVQTVLTPGFGSSTQVTLGFDTVTGAGASTVVETPLGPAPPEGFQVACGTSGACDPVYYDIKSRAQWVGETEVCIRRQFTGLSESAGALLQLLHYNELLRTWEELQPPAGGVSSFNCNDDPAVCGCADAASCGIDLTASPVQNTFLVCGMTSSFSPFAIFKKTLKFTNKVGGVEYTGPSGPPALQTWEVPADGTYRITATGARGGSATTAPGRKGGCGAEISGEFPLYAGDVIEILVGQEGTSTPHGGGGGGGTFVRHWASPLVVAGGGGGVGAGASVDGRTASLSCHGVAGSLSSDYTDDFVDPGEYGAGGAAAAGRGAGGSGWNEDGLSDGAFAGGGFAFSGLDEGRGGSAQGCAELAHGGYGGGGAGDACTGGGAGGGGGYSGGGAGLIGGGGGSVSNGDNSTLHENACTVSGHGLVTIELVEP